MEHSEELHSSQPQDYVWPLWPCIIYHIYIILAFCLLHKSDL